MDVVTNAKKLLFQNIMKHFAASPSSNSTPGEENLEEIAAQEQKHFSYEALAKATNNFHHDRKLGEGGFGPVYKGKLDNGREIAVKRLSRTSRQGKKEFQNEARLLTRIQHRNVVNLLGYCASGEEKLLVYEYVENESLDKLLFKSDRREELDWKKRYDIICGVAKGLHYLHEDAHQCIIHRDIKASNILLDHKWVPKIADFGMARLFPEDSSLVNTRAVGTNGYMAPEYAIYGDLSVKVDVYSFGVVVLELVTGQKNPIFNTNLDDKNLLHWAYRMFKSGRSLEIMDPTLAATAVEEQVALCIHIGLLCTQANPSLRPKINRVRVLFSKSPSSLVEPTSPGSTDTQYRRSRRANHHSSSNATSSKSRSQFTPDPSAYTGNHSTTSSI